MIKDYFSHPKKMSKKEWESGEIFYCEPDLQDEPIIKDDLDEFMKLCNDKLLELKKSL